MIRRYRCPTPGDTAAVGAAVGRAAEDGLVVLLQGDLGAGKTVFTKGVARGLGVPGWRYVTSPTFTIHNEYGGRLRLHHLDLYRLETPGEFEDLGFEGVLGGEGVCVLEWPDLFFGCLPPDRLRVRFRWDVADGRLLDADADGPVARRVLAAAGVPVRDDAREEHA